MTIEQTLRLTQIRRDIEMWAAINPDAQDWDSAFLMTIIDEKTALINEMKQTTRRSQP